MFPAERKILEVNAISEACLISEEPEIPEGV